MNYSNSTMYPHLSHIGPIVDGALKEAGVGLERIDAVAVTQGPGLVGSLLVGLCFGKAMAYARGVPLLAVDHIEAHIRAAYLECPEPVEHPALSLVVSGGHTSLFLIGEESRYELVGTRDALNTYQLPTLRGHRNNVRTTVRVSNESGFR